MLYGQEQKFDGKGLLFNDLLSKSSNKTTSSSFQLMNHTELYVELSEEKLKSDSSQFTNGYSIGRSLVMKLDNDNIIEYIWVVRNNVKF